jgi:hypothetical protein
LKQKLLQSAFSFFVVNSKENQKAFVKRPYTKTTSWLGFLTLFYPLLFPFYADVPTLSTAIPMKT